MLDNGTQSALDFIRNLKVKCKHPYSAIGKDDAPVFELGKSGQPLYITFIWYRCYDCNSYASKSYVIVIRIKGYELDLSFRNFRRFNHATA